MDEIRTYLSYGNALIDVIMGGGAGPVGHLVRISAPSGAGKTVLCNEIIYQAYKKFEGKVEVRYLDKEGGNSFDTERMYGFSLEDCFVENVDTVEELSADLYNFATKKKKDTIGIYVVDSWDSLSSAEEQQEIAERAKALEAGKEYKKGTYGAERAKYASKLFRNLGKTLRDNNVLMIAISQLRDNLNAGMFGKKDIKSGGRALEFYSDQQVALKVVEEHKEEGRLIGQTLKFTAEKSRCKYPKREMFLTILTEYGVDDVGTNIDYLYDLRDDYGKLKDPAVINNIPFKEESEEVNSSSIKGFLESWGNLEDMESDFKEQGLRKTQANMIAWIKENQELQSLYVEHFGIVDRESLIQYVISNELEEEYAQKAVDKWLAIEERIRPVRNRKTLGG